MRRFFLLFAIMYTIVCHSAYAVWVWTPKSQRFENAKRVGMDSPEKQEEFAKSQKKKEDAMIQWQTLLRRFPRSKEAAKALYEMGRIYLERNDLFSAYQQFIRVLKEYPYSENTPDAAKELLKIGIEFSENYKRKWWDLSKPIDNPAPEIFDLITTTLPYSQEAQKAFYQKALFYFSKKQFEQVNETIDCLLNDYPDSAFADDAEFLKIKALSEMTLRADYDQKYADEAMKAIEEFLAKYPDSSLTKDAMVYLSEMKNKKAENMFNIAEFYAKQGKKNAAMVYLRRIVAEYPDVPIFDKAMDLLDKLESDEL